MIDIFKQIFRERCFRDLVFNNCVQKKANRRNVGQNRTTVSVILKASLAEFVVTGLVFCSP